MAFFRCLSNSGTYTELWTTSFIESTGVACSDSVNHNRVQELRIPLLLLACSQNWMVNGIRTGDPRGFDKGRSSKSCVCSRVRQISKEGRRTYRSTGFKLTKERSRRYPAKTITDANYPMVKHFWQMHPPEPKPCYIVRNEPLQASASMSMHTRQNICALIKQVTSPH